MIRINISINGEFYGSIDKNTQKDADDYIAEVAADGHWGAGATFTTSDVGIVLDLQDISPRQIRLALLSIGITGNMVELIMGQLPSPQKEQAIIAWQFSNSFKRDLPETAQIGAMLGLTSAQLDQIWINGIKL